MEEAGLFRLWLWFKSEITFNSWICAPGEMSAGCWFLLLQQLQMNWLPQETRVGMCLVVPQPYGARKRKSQVLSHPGTWLKVLGGQPGSLDQTFVISRRRFQTKQKNLIFFGFEDLLCFFKAEREPQRAFLCFPLKTVLLAADHLSRTQALKCIFSLCPRLPFLPTEETGCLSPLLSQGSCFPGGGRYPSEGQGQCTVSSTTSLFPPGPMLSAEPKQLFHLDRASGWALQCPGWAASPGGLPLTPAPPFSFLQLKSRSVYLACSLHRFQVKMYFQAGVPGVGLCLYPSRDLQCCSEKGWFLGWAEFLVHPCCLDCCRCGHGVNICLNPLYPKGPWKRTLSWPTLGQFVKLQPLHIPMRRDF